MGREASVLIGSVPPPLRVETSDFVGLAKSGGDGLRKALQPVPAAVRHGSAPEREVQTGIGAVAVQRQAVREGRAEPVAGRHLAAGWREDEDRWQRRDLSTAFN